MKLFSTSLLCMISILSFYAQEKEKTTTNLDEVVVAKKRKAIEKKADRTIFDFSGQSQLNSGSVLEGLQKLPGLIISDKSLTKIERDRIWVIYIVAFFVIFFWAAFEQAGASLTYFASDQTERKCKLAFQ